MTSRICARSSGVAGWLSATQVADGKRCLERLASVRLNPVSLAVRPRADGLVQVAIDEMEGHGVLRGQPGREPTRDRAHEDRAASLLAVVVWAVAARQEAEAVAQLGEPRSE